MRQMMEKMSRYRLMSLIFAPSCSFMLVVHLLSSLQARDEVITVLKAEKLDLALLEAKYGFVTPQAVLQALQRDAIQGKADVFQEDIYEKPMEEVTAAQSQSGRKSRPDVTNAFCGLLRRSWTSWWRSSGRRTGGCWSSC